MFGRRNLLPRKFIILVLILITTVPTSDFVFLSESQIDDSSFGLSPFTEIKFLETNWTRFTINLLIHISNATISFTRIFFFFWRNSSRYASNNDQRRSDGCKDYTGDHHDQGQSICTSSIQRRIRVTDNPTTNCG